MSAITTLALAGALPFLAVACGGLTAWLLWRHRQEEAFWERRAEAESRAVLDRIARGEERTYTAAEVREMLRREGEGNGQ